MWAVGDLLWGVRETLLTLREGLQSPLRTVYRYGPWLHGYGFWNGKRDADICAQLSGVSAAHWLHEAPTVCAQLVEDQTVAFIVGCNATLGVVILFYLVVRFMCCRPVANWVQDVVIIHQHQQRSPSTEPLSRHHHYRQEVLMLDSGDCDVNSCECDAADAEPKE